MADETTQESLDNEILNELKMTNQSIDKLFSLIKAREDDRLKDKEAQATKDSEQATLDSEQAVKTAESLEAEKTKQDADVLLEKQRHAELVKELKANNEQIKALAETESSSDLLAELKDTNKTLATIADNQDTSLVNEANQVGLGTMAVAGIIVAIGAFALVKFGGYVVSKITQMIW
ncbi:hypothetical protein [Enterococcus raffinosus]|uniref:Uncharacterized protein n=1 Tax=Enterococcus raffinosus TaxID=71452 RepID=A0AAW8TF20_9ENTE|nr:hypothetical protein [Enterococcus raffinosus]MDT2546897.1 hypothetical protein [Enterococcus raffinosus]MDT2555310.1 hypothetical protein [Enterococcus raffinosus]